MRRQLIALGLGLSCGALVFASQAPAPPPGQAAPLPVLKPGTAVVVGKVVEAGTSTGVADAIVTLAGSPLGPENGAFTDGTPSGARRVTTDAQGQFLFRNLPVGAYTLRSSASGYANGWYGDTVLLTNHNWLRELEVTASDTLLSARIQMWKKGGISGIVVDEVGEPLVAASVTILERITDGSGPGLREATVVRTDDRGSYHADIVPGNYIVGVLAATTTFPIAAVEGFQQAMSEGGPAQQAYLQNMQAAGGLLPRGNGVRAGAFMVTQRGGNNLNSMPPMIVRDGQVLMYPSTYHPASSTAVAASLVTIQSGEEKAGIDLRVSLVPARRVSGQVMGSNGPVAGIALMLVAADPAAPATLIDTPQTVTDVNGAFTFLGVPPASYTLRVVRQPTTPLEPLLWWAETVSVGAETDLTNVQVQLRSGAHISGRIVVESTSATVPPAALQKIIVMPIAQPGTAASMGAMRTFVGPRPDPSQFTTREAIPGPHMMSVGGLPTGWVVKSVTAGGRNAVDKLIDVPAGGISDAVVTITDKISTLSGVARDSNGQAAPTATVAVFSADKSLWPVPGMASRRLQTTPPRRDGSYSFRGLPEGEYIVVAADWPTADFADAQVLTKLMASGSRVTLGDGEARTQDLRVVVIR